MRHSKKSKNKDNSIKSNSKMQSPEMMGIINLLIRIREFVKTSFCRDLEQDGFPEDYLAAVGVIFDVFYECKCRNEDQIELNSLNTQKFPKANINKKIRRNNDFLNALQVLGATEIEMRIMFSAMERAQNALNNVPSFYPDSKTCLDFWSDIRNSDVMFENDPYFSGDLVMPGRPDHFEQTTLIFTHIGAMEDAAMALRQGICEFAEALSEAAA